MVNRINGNFDGNFDKKLYEAASKKLAASGNEKPTSAQIKKEIEKLSKSSKAETNDSDMKISGLYIEKNPDDNTFVDYKDGATLPKTPKNITTAATNEEGGAELLKKAVQNFVWMTKLKRKYKKSLMNLNKKVSETFVMMPQLKERY